MADEPQFRSQKTTLPKGSAQELNEAADESEARAQAGAASLEAPQQLPPEAPPTEVPPVAPEEEEEGIEFGDLLDDEEEDFSDDEEEFVLAESDRPFWEFEPTRRLPLSDDEALRRIVRDWSEEPGAPDEVKQLFRRIERGE